MGLFNELQAGRFNRFAQKLLSMKGPPVLPTLSTDLQFIHTFFSGEENRFPQSWDSFSVYDVWAPLTANHTAYEIRNPVGSNTVAVLYRLAFTSNTAGEALTFNISRGETVDQTTTGRATSLDARTTRKSSLIRSINSGTAPAALVGVQSGVWTSVLGTNVPLLEAIPAGLEIPILPGDAIIVTGTLTTPPTQTSVAWWRERALEESERT